MIKTWSKVCLGVACVLLASCASSASDRNSGAERTDAGGPDASANELPDGAVADAADSGAADHGGGGHGGGGGHAQPSQGGQSSQGPMASGGAAADNPGGSSGSAGGTDHAPPSAGSGAAGSSDDSDAGAEPATICTTCGACEETIPVVSAMHTNDPVNYLDPPPSSGPHNPCWGSWGVHDQPLAAERWVHNLEHGGLVYLYNCPQGCDAEIATIKSIGGLRARTIVTAYDKLPQRFAVVSWGHRLVSDCLDRPAFEAFSYAHYGQGPESNAMAPNPSCPP